MNAEDFLEKLQEKIDELAIKATQSSSASNLSDLHRKIQHKGKNIHILPLAKKLALETLRDMIEIAQEQDQDILSTIKKWKGLEYLELYNSYVENSSDKINYYDVVAKKNWQELDFWKPSASTAKKLIDDFVKTLEAQQLLQQQQTQATPQQNQGQSTAQITQGKSAQKKPK